METDPKLARPLWRDRTNVDALTIACIEHAEQIGGHEFTVTQGSYQAGNGDENSAGTHDLGGVVDLSWCGHNNCVRALRLAGMAAWHRTPEQGPWPHHIHAVVIDHPFLSLAAQAQVIAYFDRRNGLSDNGPDDGPQLNPIPRPVWPWPEEDWFDMATLDDLRTVVEAAVANNKLDVGRKNPWSDDTVLRSIMQRLRGIEESLAAIKAALEGSKQ